MDPGLIAVCVPKVRLMVDFLPPSHPVGVSSKSRIIIGAHFLLLAFLDLIPVATGVAVCVCVCC